MRSTTFLILIGLSTLCSGAEFPELQWLHPATDRLQHLLASPAECLDLSGDSEELYEIEVGRQAFRSPALLGGQAARVGLSCQGCHINGHGHPSFFIEGSSEAAGTVDVTTAVFSEVRGDGIHNPVPIPSLVNVINKQSFGSAKLQTSLADFVKSLIVEEFVGEEPSDTLLASLVSYLSALSSSACSTTQMTMSTLDEQLLNIFRGVNTIAQSYEKEDVELADFLIMATQHELSILYQRFAIKETTEQAEKVISMSRALGELRVYAMTQSTQELSQNLRKWTQSWQPVTSDLRDKNRLSLYQRQNMAGWLLTPP